MLDGPPHLHVCFGWGIKSQFLFGFAWNVYDFTLAHPKHLVGICIGPLYGKMWVWRPAGERGTIERTGTS
jgi:hypothetical protein